MPLSKGGYEMEYKAITEDDPRGELLHYGVLGMKWGVHRARKAAQSGDSTKSKAMLSFLELQWKMS